MKSSRVVRLLVIAVTVFSSVSLAFAIKPTWARKAVTFPSQCEVGSNAAPITGTRKALEELPGVAACKPIRIPSPDKRFTVEVKYQKHKIGPGYDDVLFAYFLLRAEDGTSREGDLPYGFQNIDLLWSPDSKAFLIDGGNGSSTAGFWVYVYRIDDPKLEPLDITGQAQLDMVKTFPPCKASELDRMECLKLEKGHDYINMSGIDWSGGSSTMVVMAEVFEGGGMGGIKGQIIGYELDVPSGKIVRRMTASEFAMNWQKSMAWKFHVPDPPEYCAPNNPKEIPGCIGHDW